MVAIENSELMAGIKQNDEEAHRRFWSIYFPIVHGICMKVLGEGFSANEISVEVLDDFLTKYIHTLESPKAILTYLQLMATRRSIKEKQRLDTAYDYHIENQVALNTVSPEDRATYHLIMPRLNICLNKLTPKVQRIVKMRYFEELSNSDIAVRLGISKQYIGRMLNSTMVVLRKCLERATFATKPTAETQEVGREPAF
ncbi:MAG: RNA polymerase sigma factor [Deltaproteobacteria bacterium]|nr:RNA polymerase sigma factor [Deltaproteobacteria bacterium]